MKKISISLICFLLIGILTGCSFQEDDRGLTLSQLKESDDGYYVLKTEKEKFYRILEVEGITAETKSYIDGIASNYMFSEEKSDSIPVLEEGDCLILKASEDLPSFISLIPLTDQGWTLGMKLASVSVNGSQYTFVSGSGLTEDTSAEKLLSSYYKNLKNTRIVSVGDMNLSENILSEWRTVTGLERNQVYEVVLYEGTKRSTANVEADTRLFSSLKGNMKVLNKIHFTANDYAIVTIPEKIEDGYYIVGTDGIIEIDRQ